MPSRRPSVANTKLDRVARETMVFQDVEAIATADGVRHVFATDGSARLVHYAIGGAGGTRAENLTQILVDRAVGTGAGQDAVVGYAPYQLPFAGRVYSDLSAGVDPITGELFVYGTNGRELVEYRNRGGVWTLADLTNSLAAGQPANRVFGAPTVSFSADGGRSILLISEDAEVVQYARPAEGQFTTTNITLASGNTGSPPSYNPANPAPSPTPPVNQGATPLTPDATGRIATGAGFLPTFGQRASFRFTARFTGRVTFVLAAQPGFNPKFVVTVGGRSARARNRRTNGQFVATQVVDVKAGQDVILGVGGNRRTFGGFSISARYVRVAHPRGTVARSLASARRGR